MSARPAFVVADQVAGPNSTQPPRLQRGQFGFSASAAQTLRPLPVPDAAHQLLASPVERSTGNLTFPRLDEARENRVIIVMSVIGGGLGLLVIGIVAVLLAT